MVLDKNSIMNAAKTGKNDVLELTAVELAAISGGARTATMFLRRIWRDGALFGRTPEAQ